MFINELFPQDFYTTEGILDRFKKKKVERVPLEADDIQMIKSVDPNARVNQAFDTDPIWNMVSSGKMGGNLRYERYYLKHNNGTYTCAIKYYRYDPDTLKMHGLVSDEDFTFTRPEDLKSYLTQHKTSDKY